MMRAAGWGFVALLVGACGLGAWAAVQGMRKDARELRLCRAAKQLAVHTARFREHAERLPADPIVRKLMDSEVLAPRARSWQLLAESLRDEAPARFPLATTLPVVGSAPESRRLAEKMQEWQNELEQRARCPDLLVPEKIVRLIAPTQPSVQTAESPAFETKFAEALKRATATAAQMRESVQRDTEMLCRSREGLAKARIIHDYLNRRCPTGDSARPTAMKCAASLGRSQQHLDELAEVVHVNQTKFNEKWYEWLESTAVTCAN